MKFEPIWTTPTELTSGGDKCKMNHERKLEFHAFSARFNSQYPLFGYPSDTRVPAGNSVAASIFLNQLKFSICACSALV